MDITEWAKSWKGINGRNATTVGRDSLRTGPKKYVQR